MDHAGFIPNENDAQQLMDNSPCLAPWYFTQDKPKLARNGDNLSWEKTSEAGIIGLMDKKGNCFALLDMVTYILTSEDHKSFLIWDRHLRKIIIGLQSVRIFYYETDKLLPIGEVNKTIIQMRSWKQKFFLADEPVAKTEFAFDPRKEAMQFSFPEEFQKFGDFILLTELEDLYENPDPKIYWHNTTMLYIKTDTGWVYNYPQDWFNKSGDDFGYVWITRAIKNPETNLVQGQGIRMADFVLDATNRQLLERK